MLFAANARAGLPRIRLSPWGGEIQQLAMNLAFDCNLCSSIQNHGFKIFQAIKYHGFKIFELSCDQRVPNLQI